MISLAQYGLLWILSAFLVLHLCILLKVIPYTIVWGGRLKTDKEMVRFEAVSILINLLFLLVILVQAGFLAMDFPKNVMTILLWSMTALFVFNTFGNAFSKNKLEQRLFTPITLLLAVCSFILAFYN